MYGNLFGLAETFPTIASVRDSYLRFRSIRTWRPRYECGLFRNLRVASSALETLHKYSYLQLPQLLMQTFARNSERLCSSRLVIPVLS